MTALCRFTAQGDFVFCRARQTGRAELHLGLSGLGLLFRPRGLRFPTARFRVGLGLPRVALAVENPGTDGTFSLTLIKGTSRLSPFPRSPPRV